MISENNLTKPVVCKAPGSVSLPVQKASLKQDKKCKNTKPGLRVKWEAVGAQVFNSTTTELHTFHDSILAAKILLLILAKGNSSECSRPGLISLFPLTNERGGEGVDGGENVVLIVFILVTACTWWSWWCGGVLFTLSPLQAIEWHDTAPDPTKHLTRGQPTPTLSMGLSQVSW